MRDLLTVFMEQTDLPALLLDEGLTIHKASPAALALAAETALPDGLHRLFPGCDAPESAARLRQEGLLTLCDPMLPGLSLELTVLQSHPVLILGRLFRTGEGLNQRTAVMSAFSNAYRKPLAELFGMLGAMENRLHADGNDSCDSYLAGVSRSCYQMLRSFNNLTELYKYQNHDYDQLPEDPVDLWQMTRALCEPAALIIRDRGIPMDLELPPVAAPVLCLPRQFADALSNLISNACRFTREENAICVTGRVIGSNAVVTVSDRGAGIPEQNLGRVLEPFFSWDPEGDPAAGLGVGLSLANSFAHSCGGSLALQSRELEGTTVSLSVPLYTGQRPTVCCYDSSHLLSDRFSPLYVGLFGL